MKKNIIIIIYLLHSLHLPCFSQESFSMNNTWQIGIGLGEIPANGSIKPSITFGYHFNDKLYAGIIYQFKDKIQRDGSSFNAQSTDLQGLISSKENVAQRFLAHVRFTPLKNGPYISTGLVYNGTDTETMTFDHRVREIGGASYSGDLTITQSRPSGWGLATGIGYQYNIPNTGLSAGFEWTPAWGQYPEPIYHFDGSNPLSEEAKLSLTNKMNDGFRSSVTNLYKVFHFGIAYRIK